MKIIFGTSNKRKIEDLQNIVNELNLDIEILGMNEIGWDRGEIEENGQTIEENSLIKARALFDFCNEKGIYYPIITDDAGLFCEALDGAPGIFTARYADDELLSNPELPKHQCVIKLLRNLETSDNRTAYYRCAVTCMMPDGTYLQELGESKGSIAKEIIGQLKKPYFYSVFVLSGYDKAFSELSSQELSNTYRYDALKKMLRRVKLNNEPKMIYEVGMLCKHFKGNSLLEKNIYRIEKLGVSGKEIDGTVITYTGDGELSTAQNLVVYSNIFQDNKLFAREYEDISSQLSEEKRELYGQILKVQPLTKDEIAMVEDNSFQEEKKTLVLKKYQQ